MSELVQVLERFNRKERNWLVRDALGSRSRFLSSDFLARLTRSIRMFDADVEVPAEAWWVTDFHIDWLIAALTLLKGGERAVSAPQVNEGDIIRGTQQDIDLVVAWGSTLLLVEAKGVGSWRSAGTRDKLQRLSQLPAAVFTGIEVYLLFCSPAAGGLPEEPLPSWVRNHAHPLHIALEPPPVASGFLRVERCSTVGKLSTPDAKGRNWRILPAPIYAKKLDPLPIL